MAKPLSGQPDPNPDGARSLAQALAGAHTLAQELATIRQVRTSIVRAEAIVDRLEHLSYPTIWEHILGEDGVE